jgi:hypothetical protein
MVDVRSMSDADLLKAYNSLPPGFVVDKPAGADLGLPAGFVLDQPPSVGADIAQSLPGDVASLVSGTLGAGGNVGSMVGRGVDYAGSKLGLSPDTVSAFKNAALSVANSNPLSAIPARLIANWRGLICARREPIAG